MPAKQRIHNEWFQPITKTTCSCGCKKTQVFSWGEYASGKWRTVLHFCQACFEAEVLSRLVDHAGPCGCTFSLNPRTGYGPLPEWIKAAESQCNIASQGSAA
jgi:hypothetical protein